jgi:ABC-type polysaccharide/polyol phosphate export permease
MTKPKAKPFPIYRSATSPAKKAFADLAEGLKMAPMWAPLTIREMVGKSRRQFLGILWVPLGMLIVVFLLGYAYSNIFGRPYMEFCVYLFAGLLTWQVIQPAITGGFGLYTRQSNVIANVKIPYSYWAFKFTFELFFNYMIVLPIYFAFMIGLTYFGLYPGINWFPMVWFPLALLVYLITSFSLVLFLAVISVRVRDLEAPITSLMRILFLITPVIWDARFIAEGSFRQQFVTLNPFYHFLQIGRAPLLGETADPLSWIVALSLMCGLIVLALIAFVRARHRILYWL